MGIYILDIVQRVKSIDKKEPSTNFSIASQVTQVSPSVSLSNGLSQSKLTRN